LTAKSWAFQHDAYDPPIKKAKLSTSSKPSAKSARSPQSALRDQNARMRVLHRMFAAKRLQWLRAHYSSFRPFLSAAAAQRLRPSADSPPSTVSVAARPSQPALLCSKYSLRDYQLRSVNWMRSLRENGVPAILADEMGLGKTIQSIAVMAALYEDASGTDPGAYSQRSPSLVVCPLSVAEAWRTECQKWLPSKKCVLFHGPKLQRENMMRNVIQFGRFDVVVTTYEMAAANTAFLRKFWWSYLILDEAHRIKNEATAWHLALKQIEEKVLHTVLLTGTPMQNNMHELWALLTFMFGDSVFDEESAAIFDSAYDQNNNKQDKALLSQTPHLIQPFFLRRLKSQVEVSLPPKEEIIVKISMSSEQRNYYKTFLMAHSSLIDAVSESLHGGDRQKAKVMVADWKKLRALYMNLRKIALHPFLLENLWYRVTVANCSSVIAHSSKLQLLDALLARLKKDGHRVLLFSCFTTVLDLLEVYCEYRGHRWLRLDGSTSRIRRRIDIMRFNDDPDSPFFIYLISNRAGGLGINLQSADTVIHFDTDWNPQSDLQAQARAHRIGQTKMVKIYRLISKHTVEERILFRSQQKLYLDAVVNQGAQRLQDAADGGTAAEDTFDLDDHDLLKCIKFGAHKMMDQQDGDDDIDLDLLLQRSHRVSDGGGGSAASQKEQESRKRLLRDLSEENNVAAFDFSKPLVAGNVFEGTTYEKKEFVAADDDALCGAKRAAAKRTKTVTVDGLQFEMAVEADPMLNFYTNCGREIYDGSKRGAPRWHHEATRCWGCDGEFADGETADSGAVIECSGCPKAFHRRGGCWKGERSRLGQATCSQHRCFECGLKPSECGLILRCLGCQMSYCLECAPPTHWKCDDGDGLRFVDGCAVAKHHGFTLPRSSYMFAFCGAQCQEWYDSVYSKRPRPDLSLTLDAIDGAEAWVDRVRARHSAPAQPLRAIEVEWRVQSRFLPNGLLERCQQNMDGNWPIIQALYDTLYPDAGEDDDIEDGDDDANDANDGNDGVEALSMEPKEPRECIRGEHYLQIPSVAKAAEHALTAPQWIQCAQCRKWRVIAVAMRSIPGPMDGAWRCSKEDGFEALCDSKQLPPNKRTHSELEVAILRLQRKRMAKEAEGAALDAVDREMKALLEALRAETVCKLSIIGDDEMAAARFVGIGQWNGFDAEEGDDDDDDDAAICAFYEGMASVFRGWRIESIKTLMDHFGFFVEQKTKDRDTGHPKIAQIAMSYPKDVVVAKLCAFLMYPTESALHLKTADFSR